MRIAVNTRFLLSHKMEGFGWFTYETVKRMVEAHPEHEFIFFFDRKYDPKFVFGPNVTPVVLGPPARHPILFRIWFNISVTKALKKYQADVFFSPDGYLSLKTQVPQVAVIHDLNFEHYPEDLPTGASRYLRKYFPLFARKANHIITVSEYSRQDIVKTYQINPSLITVAHNGASPSFKPLQEDEKTAIKTTVSQGLPYFLFVGALHPRKNLKRLIQAFDQFKAKTKSSTQLVIAGENLWRNKGLGIDLETLQYKDEIHFTGHLSFEKLQKVYGGAKGLAFVSYFEGFGIPIVEAMQSGCPVLCGNQTSLPEVGGDAALYCDPFDLKDIALKLEELDQRDDLRNDLIQKGLTRAEKFSWDKSAEIIWNVIEQTGRQGDKSQT